MNRRTLRRRLLDHHLPLALASIACFLVIFTIVKTNYLPFGLSMATAYTGVLLLAVTLLLGVVKVLRGEVSPVSTDWRRDVGIWAALFSLAHLVIGLQVHAPGRMRTYFVHPPEENHPFPLRFDAFGWANHLGLLAGVLFVMLLALSNDWSLARLGARRWKGLQRWSYIVFALTVVHGVLYQVLETRIAAWVIFFAALNLVVIALQATGVRARSKQLSSDAPRPSREKQDISSLS